MSIEEDKIWDDLGQKGTGFELPVEDAVWDNIAKEITQQQPTKKPIWWRFLPLLLIGVLSSGVLALFLMTDTKTAQHTKNAPVKQTILQQLVPHNKKTNLLAVNDLQNNSASTPILANRSNATRNYYNGQNNNKETIAAEVNATTTQPPSAQSLKTSTTKDKPTNTTNTFNVDRKNVPEELFLTNKTARQPIDLPLSHQKTLVVNMPETPLAPVSQHAFPPNLTKLNTANAVQINPVKRKVPNKLLLYSGAGVSFRTFKNPNYNELVRP